MRPLLALALTALTIAAFVAAWNVQHAWPEWDRAATDYDLEELS